MGKKNIFTDAFGNWYILKRIVVFIFGLISLYFWFISSLSLVYFLFIFGLFLLHLWFISHPITADTKGTSVMHSFCCPE